MVLRLDGNDAGFEEKFKQLLAGKREVSEDVDQIVREIIEAVRYRPVEARRGRLSGLHQLR